MAVKNNKFRVENTKKILNDFGQVNNCKIQNRTFEISDNSDSSFKTNVFCLQCTNSNPRRKVFFFAGFEKCRQDNKYVKQNFELNSVSTINSATNRSFVCCYVNNQNFSSCRDFIHYDCHFP